MDRTAGLDRAHAHALGWLDSLAARPVPPAMTADEMLDRLDRRLQDGPTDPVAVVDLLAEACEPGLTAMPSGRFFGFVIGGTHPAALAADWLVSAWDQNSGLRALTPAALRGRGRGRGLAARPARPPRGQRRRLRHRRRRWPTSPASPPAATRCCAEPAGTSPTRGLVGSPGVRVLVGAERHDTIDLALRYLGLGAPEPVRRRRPGTHRRRPRWRRRSTPATAGPRWSACRPATSTPGPSTRSTRPSPPRTSRGVGARRRRVRAVRRRLAGDRGTCVGGRPTRADSWATDAHKTLNVPYDCGLAIVRDPAALRAAMGMHGDYLIQDARGEPFDKVPGDPPARPRPSPCGPCSARWAATASPTWSTALRPRAAFAEGIAAIEGAEVLNDVVFTQVCASFGDDDAHPGRGARRCSTTATAWTTGSRWHGRAVLRIWVSNWSTTEDDVARASPRCAGLPAASRLTARLDRLGACASAGSPPARTPGTASSPGRSTSSASPPTTRGRGAGRRPALRRDQAARAGAPARATYACSRRCCRAARSSASAATTPRTPPRWATTCRPSR